MKVDFDRKIKILNLILLIFIVTLFGILLLLGCKNNLNNVEENLKVGKTSQYATDTTKQITETTGEKIDKEITGNTVSTIKKAAEKTIAKTNLILIILLMLPVMKSSSPLVSAVITGLRMIISRSLKFF